MDNEYLDNMQSYIDDGGKLTHKNGLDLFEEVKRLTVMNDDLITDTLSLPDGDYEVSIKVSKDKEYISVEIPKDYTSMLLIEFGLFSAVQQIMEMPHPPKKPNLKLVKG
jgi:hypothetical protein